jgi:APA family basic amino acid/polyamine antiporter
MNYTKGLVEQFKFLILLSTLSVLVPYLFSAASYMVIRLETKLAGSGSGRIPSIILASLAFIFSLWAIAGAGQETVYWGFILLMAGVPFYIMSIWKNKS